MYFSGKVNAALYKDMIECYTTTRGCCHCCWWLLSHFLMFLTSVF